MSDKGVVFDIQRFSIHDGPGIRTTVFLKGCSLACFWCHNPEGRRPRPELMYRADRCLACGECVKVCPNHAHALTDGVHVFDRQSCKRFGECVKVCCSGALEMAGVWMTVDEVVEEVMVDRPFYDRSGGGVTISGGEPGLRSAFCREILSRCKSEGIHTAIETCGNCHWDDLEDIIEVTDLVMMDIKLVTPEKHRAATGSTNDRILGNAARLAGTSVRILFRTPIVPTVNDDPEEFERIVSFIEGLVRIRSLSSNGVAQPISLELLPFHKMATDKYRSLGLEYGAIGLDPPSGEKMTALARIAEDRGLEVAVR